MILECGIANAECGIRESFLIPHSAFETLSHFSLILICCADFPARLRKSP